MRLIGSMRVVPQPVILVVVLSLALMAIGCSSTRTSGDISDEMRMISGRLAEIEKKVDNQASFVSELEGSLNAGQYGYAVSGAAGFSSFDTLFIDEIYFEISKYQLNSYYWEILDRLAHTMAEKPSSQLHLIGHADPTGPDLLNQELSNERAKAVKRYLISKFGIPQNRIFSVGLGIDSQKYPNDTDNQQMGENKNRRTEIILVIPAADLISSPLP